MDAAIGSVPSDGDSPAGGNWLTRAGALALLLQSMVWDQLVGHYLPEQAVGYSGPPAPLPLGLLMRFGGPWCRGVMLVACGLTLALGWRARRNAWIVRVNVALLLLSAVVIHQLLGFVSQQYE